MKFDAIAGNNPIDRMRVVGKPVARVDGPLKVMGRATYAYEFHDVTEAPAYGYIVGASIAKGRVERIDLTEARRARGVIAIVTAADAGRLGKGKFNTVGLLGGPAVDHYHQALAVVVATTFEEARFAASLVRVQYTPSEGRFELAAALATADFVRESGHPEGGPAEHRVGHFETAFAEAAVQVDSFFTTPDHSHAMMEPHASMAAWDGDRLTVWTSNQMIDWGRTDLATTLGLAKEQVRILSPYVGGGFGAKLFVRADAVLAALGAKAAGRPVKVALPRPLIANNTTHRPATRQRVRIGADRNGSITAIAHESGSGDAAGGQPEAAPNQTRLLYAGPNRLTSMRLAVLDLPEGNAMRAPGEAPGMMALEVAIDELAEALGMDPVELRIRNDTQIDPENPGRVFSQRNLVRCLQEGATRFGWDHRVRVPARNSEGNWLIGTGVAAAFRNNINLTSGARIRLRGDGTVVVETDMTDIGTGSYTIIAQTAAEMMGLDVDQVSVQLGDSNFPTAAGSGGQFGANCATSGVYAACVRLRDLVAQKLGFNSDDTIFAGGEVRSGNRVARLARAAEQGELVAEDIIEWGAINEAYQQSTFGAHFVEVAVDRFTGEARVRRMLAVCAAGRILNPRTARSQVIGAMTMGVGSALMEELVVDKQRGFFVNHDLAGYEVPVHADIPHQDVVFLDEVDEKVSPMKAKGIGELGLCGVGAAIANAIYNATGVRVRDYPITLNKYLKQLPNV